jgi:hypothetical protein
MFEAFTTGAAGLGAEAAADGSAGGAGPDAACSAGSAWAAASKGQQQQPQPPPPSSLEDVLYRYKAGEILLCKAVGEVVAFWRAGGRGWDAIDAELRAAEPAVDARLAATAEIARSDSAGSREEVEAWVRRAGAGGKGGEDDGEGREEDEDGASSSCASSSAPPPRRRWVPTAGDGLSPGAKPLPSAGLGLNGSDLFSAEHLISHARAAVDLLDMTEESKRWHQVSSGALQMWHQHDRERGCQLFRVHCVLDEALVVSLGGGPFWGWGEGRSECLAVILAGGSSTQELGGADHPAPQCTGSSSKPRPITSLPTAAEHPDRLPRGRPGHHLEPGPERPEREGGLFGGAGRVGWHWLGRWQPSSCNRRACG